MSAITISGLRKCFGSVEALADIDLEVADGSVLALLGPSGCGKTTLLRLIAGFERPDAGSIAFGSRIVAEPGRILPPERRGIGYVPQEGALFPHLTVEGNIRYGLQRRTPEHKQRVREVLELTGLADLAQRWPHELSGGQQQRVALARALARNPGLVLLDEPFNALDLDLRRSMCEEVIRLLRATGTTTILVTHAPDEAFSVADRIAVMRAGRIIQCAAPETVYWHPATPEAARLTGPTIFLAGECCGDGVRCGLGNLPLPGGTCAPVGGLVDVMVRPEQIQWRDHGEGVPARVLQRSFRGSHTQVRLELEQVCLELSIASLVAPELDAAGRVHVAGCAMAYPLGEANAPPADVRVRPGVSIARVAPAPGASVQAPASASAGADGPAGYAPGAR